MPSPDIAIPSVSDADSSFWAEQEFPYLSSDLVDMLDRCFPERSPRDNSEVERDTAYRRGVIRCLIEALRVKESEALRPADAPESIHDGDVR